MIGQNLAPTACDHTLITGFPYSPIKIRWRPKDIKCKSELLKNISHQESPKKVSNRYYKLVIQ